MDSPRAGVTRRAGGEIVVVEGEGGMGGSLDTAGHCWTFIEFEDCGAF